MSNLTNEEMLAILGYVNDEEKGLVEGFCVKYSSHENFEKAWKKSRKLRDEDPEYYKNIGADTDCVSLSDPEYYQLLKNLV